MCFQPRRASRISNQTLMSKKDSFEKLLTVSLPEEKHGQLHTYAKKHAFANFSALVRYALENFDAKKHLSAPEASRQVSFRIPDELRTTLDKQARKAGVSLGHLIRTALDTLPEKPAGAPKAAPKKAVVATKAPAKKAAKPVAKKPAKKAPAKKAVKPVAKKGGK